MIAMAIRTSRTTYSVATAPCSFSIRDRSPAHIVCVLAYRPRSTCSPPSTITVPLAQSSGAPEGTHRLRGESGRRGRSRSASAGRAQGIDAAAGAVELVVDRSRENRGAGDDRNGDQNQKHHILRRHSPILVLHPGPDTGQRRLHLHEQTEKHLSPPFALYHSGTPSGALPTRARLTARE